MTFCSSAICCIAAKILDLTDMELTSIASSGRDGFPSRSLQVNLGLRPSTDARVDGRALIGASYVAESPDRAENSGSPTTEGSNPSRISSLLLLLEGLGGIERAADA